MNEGSRANAAENHHRQTGQWWLVPASLLGTVIIAGAGWAHYSMDSRKYRQKAQDELIAIAHAKAEQIRSWRNERLGDGSFFSQAPFVARDLKTLLADPTAEPARTDTLKWLTLLKGGDRYEQIVVVRPDLSELISVPTDPSRQTTPPPTEGALALQSRAPILTDLHRDADGRPHIDVLVPILGTGDPDLESLGGTTKPIAALILRLDPEHFLFPLVQSWPTPSATAEATLIRQEGKEGVYLTPLRHQATVGDQRFSIDEPNRPSAKALRGQRGVIEGIDYRGVPTLSVFLTIPDSTWLLRVKIDKEEINGPVRAQAINTALAVLALIGAMAGVLGWFWRRYEAGVLRRELKAAQALQTSEEK